MPPVLVATGFRAVVRWRPLLGPYIAALLFGGLLLAISLFAGGHDDADGDADVHADADADAGADHDHDGGGNGAVGGFLSTFASLRFWTFFFAFGGGSGVALTAAGLPELVTGAAAAVMGGVIGGFAAWAFRYLGRNQLSSTLSADEWIGKSCRVTVPVSADRPGKVRLELDGEVKDVVARAAGAADGEMAVGDEVLIVEMTDGVAKVTPNMPDAERRRAAASSVKS